MPVAHLVVDPVTEIRRHKATGSYRGVGKDRTQEGQTATNPAGLPSGRGTRTPSRAAPPPPSFRQLAFQLRQCVRLAHAGGGPGGGSRGGGVGGRGVGLEPGGGSQGASLGGLGMRAMCSPFATRVRRLAKGLPQNAAQRRMLRHAMELEADAGSLERHAAEVERHGRTATPEDAV